MMILLVSLPPNNVSGYHSVVMVWTDGSGLTGISSFSGNYNTCNYNDLLLELSQIQEEQLVNSFNMMVHLL